MDILKDASFNAYTRIFSLQYVHIIYLYFPVVTLALCIWEICALEVKTLRVIDTIKHMLTRNTLRQ